MTAALILAAGESRRMGSPKALLQYRSETFLGRLVRLMATRCAPVVVVLGASADQIREHAPSGCKLVWNPDYLSGQTSSMQCGLRALPPAVDGVLFTLVDHPAVAQETIDALLPGRPNAHGSAAPVLRIPRCGGRRGHPIWFSAELIPEFLALPTTGAARDVVRAHAAETEFFDLDDPGILADIDDPAAYRALTGAVR
ncbi:MAG TPA: nucleotidyltransferase family protein [Bryobacteraceae bacterium]|nr:nucleotidyltransferase family protein [Bryobacteraceae bacterium]